MSGVPAFVAIVVLLLLAAFLALAESSIARVSRVKAHHLLDQRRKGAQQLLGIVQEPSEYLGILRLLTVLSHVTAVVLATRVAIDRFGERGEVVAAVILTVVLFIVAEAAPRTFTLTHAEATALFAARPVRLLGTVLRPVGWLFISVGNLVASPLPGKTMPKGPFVTEEEIRNLVDVAEDEEEIEEEERELIHSIFEFGDTVVREVMAPRPDMVMVRADTRLSDALEKIIHAGYSRIPIYEGDADNIVGVLYAKDLLKRLHEKKGDVPVASLGRAPLFVPEQKKVAELLREMQQKHVHMAIVVDEYGGTAGLVTIEDLLEEIVGEIVDEYDREEPLVEPISDDTLRVDAKLPIDEVNELLDVELPHEEWDTVGGLVFGLTGRVPVPGEVVQFDSLEFRTERVTGRRIQKVVIRKIPAAETVDT